MTVDRVRSEMHEAGVGVVLTPLGARGHGATLSRAERARRTDHLLRLAAGVADPDERHALLREVVVLNCRVADAVASRYEGRGIPLEDLRQVAYEGLIKAVRRFDPERADDLLTFAVPSMRGEVQRHFRDHGWMVRPPRRIQELQSQVTAATGRLRDALGREPTHDDVCSEIGLGYEEYAEVVSAFGCFHPPSLDVPLADDEGSVTLGDLIADQREEHAAAEARCVLGPAVRDLKPVDRRLLHLRFFEQRTQQEIASELGITQSQVSRLLTRVLDDLRRAVAPVLDQPA